MTPTERYQARQHRNPANKPGPNRAERHRAEKAAGKRVGKRENLRTAKGIRRAGRQHRARVAAFGATRKTDPLAVARLEEEERRRERRLQRVKARVRELFRARRLAAREDERRGIVTSGGTSGRGRFTLG